MTVQAHQEAAAVPPHHPGGGHDAPSPPGASARASTDHGGTGAGPRSPAGRPIIVCACCGSTGTSAAYGWRQTCYQRWRRNGRPADGPGPNPEARSEAQRAAARRAWAKARAAVVEAKHEARRARVEDYGWLREMGQTRAAAAAQMGIRESTALQYERELAAQQAQRAAA